MTIEEPRKAPICHSSGEAPDRASAKGSPLPAALELPPPLLIPLLDDDEELPSERKPAPLALLAREDSDSTCSHSAARAESDELPDETLAPLLPLPLPVVAGVPEP